MLMRDDIAKLWKLRDERFACRSSSTCTCPRRDQVRGQRADQVREEELVLGDADELRPVHGPHADFVNRATGLELHQFKWLGDDGLIGMLPPGWNHLVGYDAYRPDASLVHFTIGGPWFDAYKSSEYADEWFAERRRCWPPRGGRSSSRV
jgi:hypothetical protein